MNSIQITGEIIAIAKSLGGQPWPLEIRRCHHWASCDRPDILEEFMPDMIELVERSGNIPLAETAKSLLPHVRQAAIQYKDALEKVRRV
jgi:hypothetical protein